MLIRPLISAATPRDEIPEPTAAEVEKYFLQHAAASVSVADNAKVSIIQEGLVSGLIRGRKKVEESENDDEEYLDAEGESESGYRRGPRQKSELVRKSGIEYGNGHGNDNGNRSRSVSRTRRRRSELFRRSEDSCNNNNSSNNNASQQRKSFPSSSSSSSSQMAMTTTKESFMSTVREGIRKRAEKARKKSTATATATNTITSTAGAAGAAVGGTAARSTKRMESEDDRVILEMSAERLLLMAEAVVV